MFNGSFINWMEKYLYCIKEIILRAAFLVYMNYTFSKLFSFF